MNGQILNGRYLDVIAAKGPHKLESIDFFIKNKRTEGKIDNIKQHNFICEKYSI